MFKVGAKVGVVTEKINATKRKQVLYIRQEERCLKDIVGISKTKDITGPSVPNYNVLFVKRACGILLEEGLIRNCCPGIHIIHSATQLHRDHCATVVIGCVLLMEL